MRNKDKSLKQSYERKILFMSIDSQKSLMLGSLRHSIDKSGSITLFGSEDNFPSVSLSAKKLKLFINDCDSKENENNVDVTG